MQITDIKVEGLKHHFKISIPAKTIQEKVDQRLQDLTKTLRVDGFRPGKVPLSVIQKRYNQAVYAEVVDKCLQESIPDAIKQKNVRPAATPKVDLGEMVPGKDLDIDVNLEVMPEIKPMKLDSLHLVRHKIDVEPEKIEETLESLRNNSSTTKAIKQKRACKMGDLVVIDFVGRQDGEVFDGGSAEDFQLELGSKSMIEGFEDQIIGMKPEEKKTIKVTFPKDYHKPLAGKEADFDITLKEIHEKVPAELNDEFAKKMGKESLEALREDIKAMLQDNYNDQTHQYTKRCLFDLLYETHDFPVPEEMLHQEFHAIWHQFEHERDHGHMDEDDHNKSEDELKENYHGIAERRVRLGLLLAEIGRLHNIEVQNSDIKAFLERESKKRPYYVNEILKLLRENPGVVDDLKGQLFEDKVVDFVLGQIKLEEKTVSFKEFQDIIAQDKPAGQKKKKTTKTAETKEVAKKAKAETATESESEPKPTKGAGKPKTAQKKS